MADVVLQLLEQREGLALVFLLGLLLGVGAQVDALAQVVHHRQVFLPFLVEHLQHELLLDLAHVDAGGGPGGGLGGVVRFDRRCNALAQRFFGEVGVFLQPLRHRRSAVELGGERLFEAGDVPLVLDALGRDVFADHFFDDLGAHLLDGLGDVVHVHQFVALAVDVVALVVRHVVELQQILAGVEVLPLDAALRLLDGAVDHAVLDGLALLYP